LVNWIVGVGDDLKVVAPRIEEVELGEPLACTPTSA
jgi:hypothetical protein